MRRVPPSWAHSPSPSPSATAVTSSSTRSRFTRIPTPPCMTATRASRTFTTLPPRPFPVPSRLSVPIASQWRLSSTKAEEGEKKKKEGKKEKKEKKVDAKEEKPKKQEVEKKESASSADREPSVEKVEEENSGKVEDEGVVRNRLEEHYYRSLVEDIMVLRYRHESKDAPSVEKVDAMLAELSQSAHASLDAQTPLTLNPTRRSDLLRVFSTPLSHLPTYPSTNSSSTAVTNLLAKRTADASGPGRNVRRLWRRRLVNPIDYTTVRRSAMESFLMGEKEREVRMEKGKSFSPNVARLPAIRKVVVKIWEESAVVNKNVLLGAIMSLQAITGVHASPLFAVHGDASKKIRAGMPMGAVVELSGPRAFEFLDKLIQVVLPRLREWEGVDPFVVDTESGLPGGSGSKKKKDAPRVLLQPGTITIKLPESVMGSFPDIEPHYEMFPRLFAATVTVHTSATDLEGAALVLSGFQMPFLKDAMPEVASADETKEDDDPFAKFKKRKEPAGGARRGGGKK